MIHQKQFLSLLLFLCAGPGASTAQAATADAVGAWGYNSYGQTTVPVAAWSEVKAIAAGSQHTFALKNDGSVVAWGYNEYGQTDVPVAAWSDVKAIAAGTQHSVALKNDGSVVVWGDVDTLGGRRPWTVPVAAQSGVTAIAAGYAHTVALKNDGSVVGWGWSRFFDAEMPVEFQSGVMAIAAGANHTVALKSDGSVVASGWAMADWNDFGQTAVPIAAQSGVTAIAAGSQHTVALKTDGSVVAWGNNRSGQVTGTPTTGDPYSATASPVMLGGQVLTGVIAIAAGKDYTVALKDDGTVMAWGQTAVPAGLNGVKAIAAGGSHTVALVIPTAPTITAQPLSQMVNLGQIASFTVKATGYPLNYQWRKDGLDISGATGATYNLRPGQTNEVGRYTVVVSNSAGTVTNASPVVLTVSPPVPRSVGAWGDDIYGQTTVPVAAWNGVTAIAAAGSHTVALKSDGSVVAWGRNDNGLTTVPVAAQSGMTAIAAGNAHTVALKSDGSVMAWGGNASGQVTGTPTADPYSATANPVTLGGKVLSGVTAIAAGLSHTVALKSDGSVVAWGNDYHLTNVPVSARSGVTAIAAGYFHTVALKSDGSVVVWGDNNFGETDVPATAWSGVTAVAAGWSHFVALKMDGSVVSWGNNLYGQTDVPLAALSGVTAIAAGESHTLALKTDGSVVVWGHNNFGQTDVPIAAQSGVTAMAAGINHTVVLVIPTTATIITQPVSRAANVWQSPSFTVTATGFPLYYQWRKDGMDLAGATNATYSLPLTQVSQAGSYTVVVRHPGGSLTSAPPAVLTVNSVVAPGTVVAWGAGAFNSGWYPNVGQSLVPIMAQSGVMAIAAGLGHTVALKADGSVVAWGVAWGHNNFGQTEVPIAAQSGVMAIAAGAYHTVALKTDGSVGAWGYNSYGQTTVPVAAWSEVKAIAAGRLHTLALKNDGTVVAWGRNESGQVTGATRPGSAIANPVTLDGQILSGVTAIAAGGDHTVALKNDGSVVAWGYNGFGQRTVPFAAQSGVMAIAAGNMHTVALKNDGSVVAWGYNESGQTTVPFAAQSGVTAIAAGDMHTVALKNDGSMVSWGYNGYGQTTVPSGLSGVIAIAAGGQHTVAIIGSPMSLHARRSGNGLILSWSVDLVGFTLQSTPSLTPPVVWLDSTTGPGIVGAQFTVTNATSGSSQFYRLRKM